MALTPEVRRNLEERFNAKLPLEAAALSRALAALEAGGPQARAEARRLAHKLAGAAASFGWAELSTIAALVDRCDDAMLRDALAQLVALVRKAAMKVGVASRILVVEDHALFAEQLAAGLDAPERRFEVVGSAGEALTRLAEHRFDLVLLDILLPDADGRSLLTTLRDDPETADVPVIVLSSVREPSIESECLASGADAFFNKSVPLDRLSAAIADTLVRRHTEGSASRRDQSTGLLNRAGLREGFDALQAEHHGDGVVLAMLDIDHFDHLVRAGGRAAGRDAIELLVRAVRPMLGPRDLLGRWGRDEFVAVIVGRSDEQVLEELEAAQDRVHSAQTSSTAMTFSGGVVQIEPGVDLVSAVAQADQLLHMAKRAGRDRIAMPGPQQRALTLRVLLAEPDPQTATAVSELLVQSGLQVDLQPDGPSALTAARAHRYSAIIVDRVLPDMDGFELIDRLRRDRRNRLVPIVVLTGSATDSDITHAFELGADDYIHKPFEPVELVARVQRLARRAGSRFSTAEYDACVTGG